MHTAKTYTVILVLVSSCFTVLAQSMFAQSKPAQPAHPTAVPPLDHFDVTEVDSSLDHCVDFYQYTCKKWIANNPIPPDQANWWLGSKLQEGSAHRAGKRLSRLVEADCGHSSPGG